jgi:hypothetical protein
MQAEIDARRRIANERTLRPRLDDARFRVVAGVRPEERVVEEIVDGKQRRHTTAESYIGAATVFICAAGDVHGAIERLYDDILAFEVSLGVRFDHVLQVGDFGIWPDPDRIDRATRNHGGAGDFAAWFTANRAVPRPTIFIKGNHEDFVWLDQWESATPVPGLVYLRNGTYIDLGDARTGRIRVGGVGGCYGPSDYTRPPDRLQGYAKRHYTAGEIEPLATVGGVDIVLTHDAPAGVRFERHRRGAGYVSEAAGLDALLARVRPRVCSVIITLESTRRFRAFAASD